MNAKCRDAGDNSFHVGYATDASGVEVENLTHKAVIVQEELDEKELLECGWLAQIGDDGLIQVLVSEDPENGCALETQITKETALQLADMFQRIADIAPKRTKGKTESIEPAPPTKAELEALGQQPLISESEAA